MILVIEFQDWFQKKFIKETVLYIIGLYNE